LRVTCCKCHKDYQFKLYESEEYNRPYLVCPHCDFKHLIDFIPVNTEQDSASKKEVTDLDLGTYYVTVWDIVYRDFSTESSLQETVQNTHAYVRAGSRVCVGILLYADKSDFTRSYQLYWSDQTDSSAFTSVTGTGEIILGTGTALVNGATVTSQYSRVTYPSGTTWQNGIEREGANQITDFTLYSAYRTEFRWAIDTTGADAGHIYEFELYDVDYTQGLPVGTYNNLLYVTSATSGSPSVSASRILDSSRVDESGSDDANVVDWPSTDDFIVAAQLQYSSAVGQITPKLQWRNKTDSGTFIDISSSGALTWSADTVLVHDTTVSVFADMRCSAGTGDDWDRGLEAEGGVLNGYIPQFYVSGYVECQFAVRPSGVAAKEYEFRVIDRITGEDMGTCGATITFVVISTNPGPASCATTTSTNTPSMLVERDVTSSSTVATSTNTPTLALAFDLPAVSCAVTTTTNTPNVAVTTFFHAYCWTFTTTGTDFSDDFTGTNGSAPNSTNWIVSDGSEEGALDIQDNQFRIYLPSFTGSQSGEVRSRWDAGGDFDISVDYNATIWSSWFNNTKRSASLQLYSNGTAFYIARGNSYWSSTYRSNTFYVYDPPVGIVALPNSTASSAIGKLRIVRTGSVFKAYYYKDGMWQWNGDTSGYTFTFSTSLTVTNVYLMTSCVGSYPGTGRATTYFDNFRVGADSILFAGHFTELSLGYSLSASCATATDTANVNLDSPPFDALKENGDQWYKESGLAFTLENDISYFSTTCAVSTSTSAIVPNYKQSLYPTCAVVTTTNNPNISIVDYISASVSVSTTTNTVEYLITSSLDANCTVSTSSEQVLVNITLPLSLLSSSATNTNSPALNITYSISANSATATATNTAFASILYGLATAATVATSTPDTVTLILYDWLTASAATTTTTQSVTTNVRYKLNPSCTVTTNTGTPNLFVLTEVLAYSSTATTTNQPACSLTYPFKYETFDSLPEYWSDTGTPSYSGGVGTYFECGDLVDTASELPSTGEMWVAYCLDASSFTPGTSVKITSFIDTSDNEIGSVRITSAGNLEVYHGTVSDSVSNPLTDDSEFIWVQCVKRDTGYDGIIKLWYNDSGGTYSAASLILEVTTGDGGD